MVRPIVKIWNIPNMRLTTPPIIIDQDNSFKNDALNRKGFSKSLMSLITRTKEELVICLDAPWGEGKTTFIKMWQGLLRENGIKSIYFDAFSNDYIDDAFTAIVGSIVNLIENELKTDFLTQQKLQQFKKKASKVGLQLLSWGTKLGVKAATLGVVKDSDIEELMEIKDDIAKDTSSVVTKFIEDRISSHHQEIQNVQEFKKTLFNLAENINGESGNPLVIIIDELDRCKPTYAVEIIERIKHLFSVKNIVFILAMHKHQMEEAIKCLYGINIDANSYLQKFINIDCRLPKNTEPQINDHKKYCKRLYGLHELETFGDESHLIDSLSSLARFFELSLRQLEKCFTYLSVFYASISERHLRLTPVISFLSVLKVINPKLYLDLANNRTSYNSFVETLDLGDVENDYADSKIFNRILLWMKFCLYTDEEYNNSDQKGEFDRISGGLTKYNIDSRNLIPFFCNIFDTFRIN